MKVIAFINANLAERTARGSLGIVALALAYTKIADANSAETKMQAVQHLTPEGEELR